MYSHSTARQWFNIWQTSAPLDLCSHVKRLWHLFSEILTSAYAKNQYMVFDCVNTFNDHCRSSHLTCMLHLSDGQVKYKAQARLLGRKFKRITKNQLQKDQDVRDQANRYSNQMNKVSRNYVVFSSDTFDICTNSDVHNFYYDEIDVVCSTAKQSIIELEVRAPTKTSSSLMQQSNEEVLHDSYSLTEESSDDDENKKIFPSEQVLVSLLPSTATDDSCESSSSGSQKKSAFLIEQAPISWLPYTEPITIIALMTSMTTMVIITSIIVFVTVMAIVTFIAIITTMAFTDIIVRSHVLLWFSWLSELTSIRRARRVTGSHG